MLKLAMIGTGGYAFELIKRIQTMPEKAQLIAVCSDPSRNSPGAQACRSQGINVYDNAATLIKNAKIGCSAIFVPTPIHTHFELTKLCLSNGLNVFLEKPPVATSQELVELIKFQNTTSYRVAVLFQYLYTPIIRELKRQICTNQYGKILKVRSIAAWPRTDAYYSRNSWAGKLKSGNNWILDGTINNPFAHVLANSLYLASEQPDRMARPATVQAELYRGHNIETEDTSSMRLMTDNNVEIIFNTTLCSEDIINPVTVIECEDAVIEYTNFEKISISYHNGKTHNVYDSKDPRIHMLERLFETEVDNLPYDVDLALCIPFTLAVNAAFESAETIVAIDPEFLIHTPHENDVKTEIKNINKYLLTAHNKGCLLSEINVPWARQSRRFSTANYTSFPVSPILK